jgi:hypothetical protein
MYRRGGALSTGDERRRRVERGHRIRCGYWHRIRIVPLAAARARAADATLRSAPLDRDGYHGRGDTAHVHLLLLLHLQHLHLVHVRRRGIRHGYRWMGMGMGVRVRVVIRRWGASVEGGGARRKGLHHRQRYRASALSLLRSARRRLTVHRWLHLKGRGELALWGLHHCRLRLDGLGEQQCWALDPTVIRRRRRRRR